MPDPQTGNILLTIPNRGADVGVWDTPVNNDFIAVDGMFGGVVTVGVASTPVTLSKPTGSVSAAAGPTQSQNAVVRFNGVLTANVQITLPLPGFIIVENLTTGAFVLSFRAVGSGEVVATPQGSRMHVYNDAANVRFVNEIASFPGQMVFMGGIIAVPSWMAACTVPPYVLADGSVLNVATYPSLGALYGNSFGGDGVTTFGVPDMRGRVPLAYDGTGTRITSAGCGINGQTMGAAGGEQTHVLVTAELASHIHAVTDPGHVHTGTVALQSDLGGSLGGTGTRSGSTTALTINNSATGISINAAGSGTAHNNVPPAQVSGIWLVKT